MNLKRCPFCGTDPMWLTKVTLECNNAECVIGGHKIRGAAAWNTRATPPEVVAPVVNADVLAVAKCYAGGMTRNWTEEHATIMANELLRLAVSPQREIKG